MSRFPENFTPRGSERKSVCPALRVTTDGSASTELFMAQPIGMTFKGLPICMVADGKPIVTTMEAQHISDLFGPPTHYFLGSTDLCWLLTAQQFAKFIAQAGEPGSIGMQPPKAGWFSPLARIWHWGESQRHAAPSLGGGGFLTRNIEFS